MHPRNSLWKSKGTLIFVDFGGVRSLGIAAKNPRTAKLWEWCVEVRESSGYSDHTRILKNFDRKWMKNGQTDMTFVACQHFSALIQSRLKFFYLKNFKSNSFSRFYELDGFMRFNKTHWNHSERLNTENKKICIAKFESRNPFVKIDAIFFSRKI